ncbi:MAG TPA: hypothetical protein VIA06_20405 [Candidatus Dormibacteraeota bacterium]|nr:hypothetical protein [Candidatus Dormibacteraeota bacterium]
MLELVIGVVAALLLLTGVGIILGPNLPRLLFAPRSHRRRLARPFLTVPGSVHPTVERALTATSSLISLLDKRGLRRQAAALRSAGDRLRREEEAGIYAMGDVLRVLRRLDLSQSPDEASSLAALLEQISDALRDRAEQLELLPRH